MTAATTWWQRREPWCWRLTTLRKRQVREMMISGSRMQIANLLISRHAQKHCGVRAAAGSVPGARGQAATARLLQMNGRQCTTKNIRFSSFFCLVLLFCLAEWVAFVSATSTSVMSKNSKGQCVAATHQTCLPVSRVLNFWRDLWLTRWLWVRAKLCQAGVPFDWAGNFFSNVLSFCAGKGGKNRRRGKKQGCVRGWSRAGHCELR